MKKNGQYVGVDEKYIPEDEKYVDNVTNNELKDTINNGMRSVNNYITDKDNQEKIKNTGKKGLKVLKGLGIGYLVFIGIVLLLVISIFVLAFTTVAKMTNKTVDVYDKTTSIIDGVINDDGSNSGQTNKGYNKIEIKVFNAPFELYNGSQSGLFLDDLLDQVVTNNKTEDDHIITVVYNTTMTAVPDEISALKQNLEDGKEYEVSLDYDSDGFVNKITIK